MSAEKEPIPGAKIVLVGASATGAKTSLAIRFVKGVFDCEVSATIGAQYLRKVVEVDGIRMKLEIWGLHLNTMNKENTPFCDCIRAQTRQDKNDTDR